MVNREIKFRAWDKTNPNKMYYEGSSFLVLGGKAFILSPHHKENLYSECADKDRFVIMQYVGLKDKNNKEIYEGDIVKIYTYENPNPFIRSVVWHQKECCFRLRGKNTYDFNLQSISVYEIIGNIYENPELLK